VRHQPGKRVAGARIDLLETECLVVPASLHEQTQVRPATNRLDHLGRAAIDHLELGVLLECQVPLPRHPHLLRQTVQPARNDYFFFPVGVFGLGGSPSDQTALSNAKTSGSKSRSSARTKG